MMRRIEVPKLPQPDIDFGPAPMLEWIDIARLVVDETYQRDLRPKNWAAIRRIAASFRWSRFSPVFVSPVEGGRYAIIDGQHRVHAAAIAGIESVPCQIVHMTQEEQAAAFAAVNGDITKVTTWQVLKAAVAAGEPWAREASEIAKAGGCELMTQNASSWTKKPGQIFAVSAFRKLIEKHGSEPVAETLRILMRADGYRDTPEAWEGNILIPLMSAMLQRPSALAESKRLIDLLELFPLWDVIEEISAHTKTRIMRGLPYAPKKEQLTNRALEAIDEKFPPARQIASAHE